MLNSDFSFFEREFHCVPARRASCGLPVDGSPKSALMSFVPLASFGLPGSTFRRRAPCRFLMRPLTHCSALFPVLAQHLRGRPLGCSARHGRDPDPDDGERRGIPKRLFHTLSPACDAQRQAFVTDLFRGHVGEWGLRGLRRSFAHGLPQSREVDDCVESFSELRFRGCPGQEGVDELFGVAGADVIPERRRRASPGLRGSSLRVRRFLPSAVTQIPCDEPGFELGGLLGQARLLGSKSRLGFGLQRYGELLDEDLSELDAHPALRPCRGCYTDV